LPADAAVDAEEDLGTTAGDYVLQARLNVSLSGIDPQTAQDLVDGAHRRCPYSKAVRGNIHVETHVVQTGAIVAV
jgi:organic hydroperoxide reductase OsmC/OhrA